MGGEKLSHAISRLINFEDSLPHGNIEEKHVELYQATLADIQRETGYDLTPFSIPPTELKRIEHSYPRTPAIGNHPGSPGELTHCPENHSAFLPKPNLRTCVAPPVRVILQIIQVVSKKQAN